MMASKREKGETVVKNEAGPSVARPAAGRHRTPQATTGEGSARAPRGTGAARNASSTDTDEEILRIKRRLLERSKQMRRSLRGVDRQVEELERLQALRNMTFEEEEDTEDDSSGVVEVVEVESSQSVVEVSSGGERSRGEENPSVILSQHERKGGIVRRTKESIIREPSVDPGGIKAESSGDDGSGEKLKICRRSSRHAVTSHLAGDADNQPRGKRINSPNGPECSKGGLEIGDVQKLKVTNTHGRDIEGRDSGKPQKDDGDESVIELSSGGEGTHARILVDSQLLLKEELHEPVERVTRTRSRALHGRVGDESDVSQLGGAAAEVKKETPNQRNRRAVINPSGQSGRVTRTRSRSTETDGHAKGIKGLSSVKIEGRSDGGAVRGKIRKGAIMTTQTGDGYIGVESDPSVVEITSDEHPALPRKKGSQCIKTAVGSPGKKPSRTSKTRGRGSEERTARENHDQPKEKLTFERQMDDSKEGLQTPIVGDTRAGSTSLGEGKDANLSKEGEAVAVEVDLNELGVGEGGSDCKRGGQSIPEQSLGRDVGRRLPTRGHRGAAVDDAVVTELERDGGDLNSEKGREGKQALSEHDVVQDKRMRNPRSRSNSKDASVTKPRPQDTSKKRLDISKRVDLVKEGGKGGSRSDGCLEVRSGRPLSQRSKKMGAMSDDSVDNSSRGRKGMKSQKPKATDTPESVREGEFEEGDESQHHIIQELNNDAKETTRIGHECRGRTLTQSPGGTEKVSQRDGKTTNNDLAETEDHYVVNDLEAQGGLGSAGSVKDDSRGVSKQKLDEKGRPQRHRSHQESPKSGREAGLPNDEQDGTTTKKLTRRNTRRVDEKDSTTESEAKGLEEGHNASRKLKTKLRGKQTNSSLPTEGGLGPKTRISRRKRPLQEDKGNEGDVESELDTSISERPRRKRRVTNYSKLVDLGKDSEETAATSSVMSTEEDDKGKMTPRRGLSDSKFSDLQEHSEDRMDVVTSEQAQRGYIAGGERADSVCYREGNRLVSPRTRSKELLISPNVGVQMVEEMKEQTCNQLPKDPSAGEKQSVSMDNQHRDEIFSLITLRQRDVSKLPEVAAQIGGELNEQATTDTASDVFSTNEKNPNSNSGQDRGNMVPPKIMRLRNAPKFPDVLAQIGDEMNDQTSVQVPRASSSSEKGLGSNSDQDRDKITSPRTRRQGNTPKTSVVQACNNDALNKKTSGQVLGDDGAGAKHSSPSSEQDSEKIVSPRTRRQREVLKTGSSQLQSRDESGKIISEQEICGAAAGEEMVESVGSQETPEMTSPRTRRRRRTPKSSSDGMEQQASGAKGVTPDPVSGETTSQGRESYDVKATDGRGDPISDQEHQEMLSPRSRRERTPKSTSGGEEQWAAGIKGVISDPVSSGTTAQDGRHDPKAGEKLTDSISDRGEQEMMTPRTRKGRTPKSSGGEEQEAAGIEGVSSDPVSSGTTAREGRLGITAGEKMADSISDQGEWEMVSPRPRRGRTPRVGGIISVPVSSGTIARDRRHDNEAGEKTSNSISGQEEQMSPRTRRGTTTSKSSLGSKSAGTDRGAHNDLIHYAKEGNGQVDSISGQREQQLMSSRTRRGRNTPRGDSNRLEQGTKGLQEITRDLVPHENSRDAHDVGLDAKDGEGVRDSISDSGQQEMMSPRSRRGRRTRGSSDRNVPGAASVKDGTLKSSSSGTNAQGGVSNDDEMIPPRHKRQRKAVIYSDGDEWSGGERDGDISGQEVTSSTTNLAEMGDVASIEERNEQGEHSENRLGESGRTREDEVDSCQVTSSTAGIGDDSATARDVPSRGRRGKRQRKSIDYRAMENGDDDAEESVTNSAASQSAELQRVLATLTDKDREMLQELILEADKGIEEGSSFLCQICRARRVRSLPAFVQHLKYTCQVFKKSKQNSQDLDCTLCDKKYKQRGRLEHHMKKVHPVTADGEAPVKASPPCKPKHEAGPSAENLIKKFKAGTRVRCSTPGCPKSFSTYKGFRYHEARCGKELTFEHSCPECGKKYASDRGLAYHVAACHTERPPEKVKVEDEGGKQESEAPLGRRGAAAKAMKKLHEIAESGEIIEESPATADNDIFSDMANSKSVQALYVAPENFKPTESQREEWRQEHARSGRVNCPFCKVLINTLSYMALHLNRCSKTPNYQHFICRTCAAKFLSRRMVLKHLNADHRQLVEEAMTNDAPDPEPEEEDAEEFEDKDEDLEEEEEDGYDEDRRERRTSGRHQPDNSTFPISVDQPVKVTRRFRQLSHCSKDEMLFGRWNADITNWKLLSDREADEYHPRTKVSCTFMTERKHGMKIVKEKTACQRLPLYGATQGRDSHFFFTGGPVRAAAWCPVPEGVAGGYEYAAISCCGDMDHTQFFPDTDPSPNLIQIWSLGLGKNKVEGTAQMMLGLAHDYGVTNDLAWCPSGAYQPPSSEGQAGSPRLGLLAAACATGVVLIHSIPYPDEERPLSVYRPVPQLILRPVRNGATWVGQCFGMDWSQNRGHAKIAAGFGNGTVSIWNLNTTSQLLQGEEGGLRCLYPVQTIFVGNSTIKSVCLNPIDDCFLAVVGANREISLWDTRFPDAPLNEFNLVSGLDCQWLLYYPMAMVATEKVAIRSTGCGVFPLDPGHLGSTPRILWFLSAVFTVSMSDWLHCVVGGSENGRVGIDYKIFGAGIRHSRRQPKVLTDIALVDIPPEFKIEEAVSLRATDNSAPMQTNTDKLEEGDQGTGTDIEGDGEETHATTTPTVNHGGARDLIGAVEKGGGQLLGTPSQMQSGEHSSVERVDVEAPDTGIERGRGSTQERPKANLAESSSARIKPSNKESRKKDIIQVTANDGSEPMSTGAVDVEIAGSESRTESGVAGEFQTLSVDQDSSKGHSKLSPVRTAGESAIASDDGQAGEQALLRPPHQNAASYSLGNSEGASDILSDRIKIGEVGGNRCDGAVSRLGGSKDGESTKSQVVSEKSQLCVDGSMRTEQASGDICKMDEGGTLVSSESSPSTNVVRADIGIVVNKESGANLEPGGMGDEASGPRGESNMSQGLIISTESGGGAEGGHCDSPMEGGTKMANAELDRDTDLGGDSGDTGCDDNDAVDMGHVISGDGLHPVGGGGSLPEGFSPLMSATEEDSKGNRDGDREPIEMEINKPSQGKGYDTQAAARGLELGDTGPFLEGLTGEVSCPGNAQSDEGAVADRSFAPGNIDAEIADIMKACQSTLDSLDTSVTSQEGGDGTPEVGAQPTSAKRKRSGKILIAPKTSKKKPCIMDKGFDIRPVLEQLPTEGKGVDGGGRRADVVEIRTQFRAWRPTYQSAASSRCVVYRDYKEANFTSESWKAASRKMTHETLGLAEPSTEYTLNAVTKVIWSPNFHSRHWLLVAGQSGLVRLLKVECKPK